MDNTGSTALDLARFDISSKTGFIPNSPLTRMPGDYFNAWESVLRDLPNLIERKQLRREVDHLPEVQFSNCTLNTEEEWRRAYVILSFLGQAYLWMDGEAGLVDKLPEKLAKPWIAVSEHLGMCPVGCYASVVLYNYGLSDVSGPLDAGNLHALQTFTGTKDESWFYMVHVLVELAAVPGLNAMVNAYDSMADQDNAAVETCLKTIQESLEAMKNKVNKMYDSCDAETFFVTLRPFLAGSNDPKNFPNGVIYEGDTEPSGRKYHGGSAAQSPVVYAFDVFFKLQHSCEKDDKFVKAMRNYMPLKHRQFLETMKEMRSVKDFCKESGNSSLISSYNNAIDEFVEFRKNHIILVTHYIINQIRHSVNPSLDQRGTGGTDLIEFLKRIRDDTKNLKLQ